MRVVSDRLGHTTTSITSYLHAYVLPTVTRPAAEAIAAAVALGVAKTRGT